VPGDETSPQEVLILTGSGVTAMLALRYHAYGDPDVLRVEEAPEPHAGPGKVRIAVRASSVNPFDCKQRAGRFAGGAALRSPAIPGVDAAGVVDEVGEGVAGVRVGDEVFGIGSRTCAEYAVLGLVARKPEGATWAQAAGMGVVVEAAARCLDLAGVTQGTRLLVDGAAGGVGSAAVQLAVARGAAVIGTASAANHAYLTSLGATPTTYGPGLRERVAGLAPGGIDAAIDTAGRGSVPDLVALTGEPRRVVSTVDTTAPRLGALYADSSRGQASYALAEAARLFEEGRFIVAVERVYPLREGAAAHRHSESGHLHGKIVISVP
jgi:NADPH:quinone reductase-like Zn-dependent oxidoreductase